VTFHNARRISVGSFRRPAWNCEKSIAKRSSRGSPIGEFHSSERVREITRAIRCGNARWERDFCGGGASPWLKDVGLSWMVTFESGQDHGIDSCPHASRVNLRATFAIASLLARSETLARYFPLRLSLSSSSTSFSLVLLTLLFQGIRTGRWMAVFKEIKRWILAGTDPSFIESDSIVSELRRCPTINPAAVETPEEACKVA
jgi:hypothetical protein